MSTPLHSTPQTTKETTMSRFAALRHQLQHFLDSKATFKVVYYTHTATVAPLTKRLCILDSSFNPPHFGHFSLIKKSVTYPYHGQPHSTGDAGILLMFSVENCDKKTPQHDSFEHRLNMMCLLADEIKNSINVPVFVALTDKPIFADKSLEVQKWLRNAAQPKLTFLLGYDTLIRVFDNKYYKPTPTVEALKEFMDQNDLFSLTRGDAKSQGEQMEYLDRIKRGEDPECLPQWGDKIFLVEGNSDTLGISSSSIRMDIINGGSEWEKLTFKSIIDYIKEYKPY